MERMIRNVLALVLPRPGLFRAALVGGAAGAAAAGADRRGLDDGEADARDAGPGAGRAAAGGGPPRAPQVHRAEGARRGRVALLTGCAQTVLAPSINEATIRLLTRMGVEVVVTRGPGLLRGARRTTWASRTRRMRQARANIEAWAAEAEGEGLDAVVINASGCGTTVKDYGHMFREAEPGLRDRAARIAGLAKDVSEVLTRFGYAPAREKPGLAVAYHAACSLQHGQQITALPKALLERAGFVVRAPAEAHLCCGSAGTYNILQPEIAGRLPRAQAREIWTGRGRTSWPPATSAA